MDLTLFPNWLLGESALASDSEGGLYLYLPTTAGTQLALTHTRALSFSSASAQCRCHVLHSACTRSPGLDVNSSRAEVFFLLPAARFVPGIVLATLTTQRTMEGTAKSVERWKTSSNGRLRDAHSALYSNCI